MNRGHVFFIVSPLILFITVLFSYTDVPESQKAEVEHLLKFIRNSGCRFERNGKMHDSDSAAQHIWEKYEYLIDDNTSTETFIEYSATKSMISGKYYLVHCGGGDPVKTSDWLLVELKRYRSGSDEN